MGMLDYQPLVLVDTTDLPRDEWLAYRRKGIAYQTLNLLVADAKNKGIDAISLEATEMGRPLYEKFGFTGMNDEMELKKSV